VASRRNLLNKKDDGCLTSTTTHKMPSNSPPLYRPTPRRPFNHTPLPQQPPSPLLSPTYVDETPSRTHSILNLTSSTLLGIYAPTGYKEDTEQSSTPWGTGAETPASSPEKQAQRRPDLIRRPSANVKGAGSGFGARSVVGLVLRGVTLFGLGMLYGLLVRHLHDERQLAPFQVEGIIKPSNDWRYLVFWGIAGVALGSLLPWVDTLWEENFSGQMNGTSEMLVEEKEVGASADWTPVVRSVGAFVGIAFAIVRLPSLNFLRQY